MAFYDKFPYTNYQEINLDRIIKELMEVKQGLDFVIENSSLKYADPIAWNITKQYQANTVVIDPATGIAYLSTRPVPNNVQITDTGYWTQIFDLSALFNDIQDEITALTNALASETTARETADTEIETAYQAADTVLASDISTETANRETADTQITEAYQAADTNITEAYQTADSALSDRITANTQTITSNYNQIMNLLSLVALGDEPSVLTVGKAGCRYQTINEALTYAKTYATAQKRVTIVIMSGDYDEQITVLGNPGIDFVGIGNPRVIYASVYPNAPFYGFGDCNVIGITFINSNNTGNAYACHIEQQDSPTTQIMKEMHFVDCTFISSANAALGIGMGPGTARFYGCSFWENNQNSVAIYAHNLPTSTSGQYLGFYRCDIHATNATSVLIHNARAIQGNTGTSPMLLVFSSCILEYGKAVSYYDGSASYTSIPSSGEVALGPASLGNNALGLNYNP